MKVRPDVGEQTETVWLVDWPKPDNNDFGVAEEVTVLGVHTKRPDVVLYVNGIAAGVLELKPSIVSVTEGIRQNLDSQKKDFLRSFYTTVQLVMAGNETEGLRHGNPDAVTLAVGHRQSRPDEGGLGREPRAEARRSVGCTLQGAVLGRARALSPGPTASTSARTRPSAIYSSPSRHSVSPLTNQDQPKAHNANDSSQNTGLMAATALCWKNPWYNPTNAMHASMIAPHIR